MAGSSEGRDGADVVHASDRRTERVTRRVWQELFGRRAGRPGRSLLALMACLSLVAGPAAARVEPQTDDERAFYLFGLMLSKSVSEAAYDFSESELELMLQGLRDALTGRALELDESVYAPRLEAIITERREIVVEKEKRASAAFLAKAGETEGAKTTDSGLIYTELRPGRGAQPGPTDVVRVHYHGTLRDGTVFDSSIASGKPKELPLYRMIACWTEGVPMMRVGGKAKLICPAELAYGDRGTPLVPGGAALIYEIELLDVVPN